MSAAQNDTQYPNPEVLGGLVAICRSTAPARPRIFISKAFAAKEAFRYPEDESGRTMHIHLYVNGSSLMLSDSYPEHGHPAEKPKAFNLTLQVKDIDKWWQARRRRRCGGRCCRCRICSGARAMASCAIRSACCGR